MFKSLVLSALGVAFVAGLVLTAMQNWQVTPIILAAEVYEIPDVAVATDGHSHDHGAESWSPEDGFERAGYSTLSNILAAFGFGLILIAAMKWANTHRNLQINIPTGIAAGVVGYLTFFFIPSLGLPPEIPGMEAAVLEGRQSWWLMSVVTSLAGFYVLIFMSGFSRVFAVLLFALPWIIGAPQPETHGFSHPDAAALEALHHLANQFMTATHVTNGIFWLVLGGLTAAVLKRRSHE
ncbi:MAG: cobalt transporter subunit CbtA [Oceanospirillaceae bacterium]|jgi:cobalt transporter subunit CbtA